MTQGPELVEGVLVICYFPASLGWVVSGLFEDPAVPRVSRKLGKTRVFVIARSGSDAAIFLT